MLSAVLRSNVAIRVSIQIMDAFVAMRKVLFSHNVFLQRMDSIERRQLETDQKFERVFKALEGNSISTQGVFFDGRCLMRMNLPPKLSVLLNKVSC